jgi:probable rRNA maturation factor
MTTEPQFHEFPLPNGTLLVQVDAAAPNWPDAPVLCHAILQTAAPKLKQLAKAAVPYTLTVRLSDDTTVQTLNSQFRQKDYATNVLSFPADDDSSEDGEWYVGDIIISLPTTQREAATEGKQPNHHLQHLTLHGLLHLLGYDHMTEAEAAEMESLEKDLLALLGIPNPYEDADA